MSVSINGTNGLTFGDGSAQNTGGYTGFRNRIINGAMMIDQRNAGASVTPTNTPTVFGVDRWQFAVSTNSKLTAQQNAGAITPPVGFANYLGVTSSSAYSVTSGDYFLLSQTIEGFNVSDLAWGTSNASTVTLSFKVYSSLTGTFGGALENSALNRCYPFSYTVSTANTWTTVTLTIAGDTSGTWLTNNGVGIWLRFGLGVGSSYGSGTAGAWSATRSFCPSGSVSVVGTSGATFYITGVQLEKGSVATPFEHRPYGMELGLCQRYYWTSTGINMNGNSYPLAGLTTADVYLPVYMRSSGTLVYTVGGGTVTGNTISVSKFILIGPPTGFFVSSATLNSEL